MDKNYDTLLNEIEIWMKGKINCLEDIAKNNIEITNKGLSVNNISIYSDGFLKDRILEILQQNKYIVCLARRAFIGSSAGGIEILRCINTKNIEKIYSMDNESVVFSSYDTAHPLKVKFNKKTEKYNIEFFQDLESAELFIEVGGFNNE